MNKTNIRRVATALLNRELAARKRWPVFYDQNTFRRAVEFGAPECGTNACIAGHAVALLSPKSYRSTSGSTYFRKAAALFGLSVVAADELFKGRPYGFEVDPTIKQAALVLFNLAETGKVDWDAVRQ